MKHIARILAACLTATALCCSLAACSKQEGNSSGTGTGASYSVEGMESEAFSVNIKASDTYKIEKPSSTTFVILDKDEKNVATVSTISAGTFSSYKEHAASNASFKDLSKDGKAGFSYTSTENDEGTEFLYVRGYLVSENTALFMTSDVSDAVLGDVADLMSVELAK